MTRASLLIFAMAVLAGGAGLLAGRWLFAPPAAPTLVGERATMLQIGDRRDDVSLADLDGVEHPLSEFDGAPLLINFWATWCPPCVRELPLLDAWHARRDTDGIAVLAVALEHDRAAVQSFVAERELHLPVRMAEPARNDLSTRFGNSRGVLPYSVLLGADGRLLAQKLGELDEATLERWRELAATASR